MPPLETAQSYEQLASRYHELGDDPMRDRFLVLAADALLSAGKDGQSESLRLKLLQHNPHHLLKPYDSMAHAMKSADVRNYVDGLRRHYPPAKLPQLAESLKEANPVAQKAKIEAVNRIGREASSEGLTPHSLKDSGPPGSTAKNQTPNTGISSANRRQFAAAAGTRATDVYAMLPITAPPNRDLLTGRGGAEDLRGAWLATALFWLTLVTGTILAVYVLGRPFTAP
jgi:hypothetical protein